MSKKILTLLLAILVTLGAGEILLQVRYRTKTGTWLWEYNPFRVGFTAPVSDRRHYALRTDFKDPRQGLTINEFGFRSIPITSGEFPLVVSLGDSVPFGAGVADNETYPAQLELYLNQRHIPMRVLNAGVPSYNLRQSFDRLWADVLPRYPHPRVVTIQAANDVSLLSFYQKDYSPDVTWAESKYGFTKMLLPGILRDSFLNVALFYYLNKTYLTVRRSIKSHTGHAPHKAPEYYPGERMVQNITNVLEENLTMCDRHSIRVIVLPINPFYYQTKNTQRNPALSRWKPNEAIVNGWDPLVTQVNDVLRDACRKHPNAIFLDTRPILDDLNREELYLDYIHLNPKGNRIVADTLGNTLIKNRIVAPS